MYTTPAILLDAMADPTVSVVLPVRNGMRFLPAALESLRAQTLEDFEVVALNDGSVDESGEILDRWAAGDDRFRVVHLPASGLVAALNAGLAVSRAPVIARMDADDICHRRRLELQLEMLGRRPEVDVVSCGVRFFPRSRVGEGFRIYEAWLNSLRSHHHMARERFVESPVAHPSAMVRRPALEQVGGYRDNGWPEDYDLWLRLFEAGAIFARVDRPLYFWREHPERMTRRDARYSPDAFRRCRAHFLLRGPLAGAAGIVVWGAGQTGRRLSRALAADGRTVEAFVDIDPVKIGRRLRGRPIIPAGELPNLVRPGVVVLAAVASRGARDLIRGRLDALGLVEGETYWCVA